MNDEYYDDASHPQKSGSVLPWILLTVVVVFAGVGVVAMKTQMDQAMSAVEKLKADVAESRKRAQSSDEKRQDLEKELISLKADRDDFEKQKNDLTKRVDDLNQQLELAKAAAADTGKGGKPGARSGGKKIQVVSLKGGKRRH